MCGKQQLRTAGGVEYVLQRKKVKRINLRLRPDGTAAVSAPSWVPAEQIDRFVASHAEWVCRAREKAARRAEALAVPPPDAAQCRAVFAAADAVVWPLVANALGNRRPEIRVRDMKTRWGVCSPAQYRITLASRLAAQPTAAVEYVLLHEYVHFFHPDHQAGFWGMMARLMPDYAQRRALLRQSV